MNSPTKILIAEDNPEIAKRMVALISTLSNITIIGPAEDGAEAIRLFQSHSPDVAILDLQMPYFSGLEVLQEIRKEDTKCLVCILTGKIEPSIRYRCLSAGANYFMSKIMDFGRIPDIIRSL